MTFRPWYRAWPETAALCFGIAWIPLLPRRAVVGLSRLAARIGFRYAHDLRETGRANLELVFGDALSPDERDAVLRESFQSFALLVLDIIWFALNTRKRLERWFAWDDSTAPLFEDEAQLLLVAHYGNWENLGQAYAARGQPIFSVAAPLKNQPVDRIFIRIREKTGQGIIPQKGAARKLLQGLKRRHKLAVLLDQNIRPRDGGMFLPVMGRLAPVSAAPAALAVKTGARILAVTAVANARGRYTVTVHDDLRADADAEDPVADLTRRMADSLEQVIRARPGPWCWMYKRWRLVPEGEPLEAYPPYARRVEPGDFRYGA